jgi:hypothetical protein
MTRLVAYWMATQCMKAVLWLRHSTVHCAGCGVQLQPEQVPALVCDTGCCVCGSHRLKLQKIGATRHSCSGRRWPQNEAQQ